MSYNPNNRYRNRSKDRFKRFVKGVITICLLIGVGIFIGREYNQGEANVFRSRVKVMEEERETLQEDIVTLRAAAQTASMRYDALKSSYDAINPDGPMGDLLTLVKDKVAQGMDVDYLRYTIETAGAPRKCSEPQTKRFVPSTPNFKGADNTVSIDDAKIMVSGEGQSAFNDNGEPEAWFDPSKKVAMTFKATEMPAQTKSKIVPFSHSMIIDNKEYRFTIEAGAKSFLKVSYDVCDYYRKK